jgi:hypothetical protein
MHISLTICIYRFFSKKIMKNKLGLASYCSKEIIIILMLIEVLLEQVFLFYYLY